VTCLRVLYVIPGGVFGGAHNQVVELSRSERFSEIKPIVLLPDEPGDAAARLEEAGLEVHVAQLRRLRAVRDPRVNLRLFAGLPRQIRFLTAFIRRLHVDVVQIHGITQVDVAAAARLARRGLIWQLLDTRAPRWLAGALRPVLARLPDVIMTTGSRTLTWHVGSSRPSSPVVPYFPPVSGGVSRPSAVERRQARRALAVRDDDVLIVSVGNLNPQKGHQYLLRAVAQLDGSNHRCVIKGSISPQHPDYMRELESLASSLNLAPGTLVAQQASPSVRELMHAADIFCLASEPRSEGLPTVIIEAMTAGLPVVASDVGGVSELVEDGATGFLVPSRDVSALAETLQRLASSPQLRRQMGLAGYQRALLSFGLDRCVDANLEALRLAAKRTQQSPHEGEA
jgi:glycosyltransferase involved in cell wall biosynthesis